MHLELKHFNVQLFHFSDLKWMFYRFEGLRCPRFEPPPQRFSGPPRFDSVHHFGMPSGGKQIRLGPPARFENPLRQNVTSRFERPPGLHLGPTTGLSPQSVPGSQVEPNPVNETNSQLDKPDSTDSCVTPDKNENRTPQNKPGQKSMSDDVMDSDDGFFVQSDPIPQSQADKGKKTETVRQVAKEEESKKDTSNPNPSSSLSGPIQPMLLPNTGNKTPEAPKNINAPQQRHQPSQQGPFQADMSKEPPGTPHEMNHSGPLHTHRGRGRGHGPLSIRGRGRGRGRGQIGRPMSMSDPNYHGADAPYEQPQMEENYDWGDYSQEPHRMMNDQEADKMWQSKEFQKEYYQETEERAPSRGQINPAEGLQEHWEEEQSEYWKEGKPYWADRRPSMVNHRPSFPPEGPRRPPFQPRFMHHGPRRPPPLSDMEREPHGPPPHMGPCYRRGGPGPWGPPPRHDMMRRPPPPPHELLEREPVAPPGYHEEMDRDPGWPHSHGREPRHSTLPSLEIGERNMRRPPMRPHPMLRDSWRRPPHEDPQGGYEQEYGTDFVPEDDGYGGAPPEHRHRDYREDEEFYHSREEWRRERPECEFSPHPPRRPPPDHLRDDSWREERDRPFLYENKDRLREERKGPGYAVGSLYRDRDMEPPFNSCLDWERPPPPPLPDRVYTDPSEKPRSVYERNPERPMVPQSSVPEAQLNSISPGETKTVLALSQRQHEIILKAAQELKMIRYTDGEPEFIRPCCFDYVKLIIFLFLLRSNRELQESKKGLGDSSYPDSTGMPPEIPAGLLGLDIPPEVKSALQVDPCFDPCLCFSTEHLLNS